MKVEINKKEAIKLILKKTIKVGVIASVGLPNVAIAEDIKDIKEIINNIKL